MPDDYISVDQFMNDHKGSSFRGVAYKAARGPKSFDEKSRTARFVMSTAEEDRDKDIIKTSGLEVPDHLPAFYNHSPNQQVGSWNDFAKGTKYLEGTLAWAEEGTNQWVDMSFSLARQKHLRGASIGFIPKVLKGRTNEKNERIQGYVIEEAELVECSIVAVPSNRGAGIKGLEEHGVPPQMVEWILDELVRTPAGLIVSKAAWEQTHKEQTGERTSIVIPKAFRDEISTPIREAIAMVEEKVSEGALPVRLMQPLVDLLTTAEAKCSDAGEQQQQRQQQQDPAAKDDITADEKGILQRLYEKFFGDPQAEAQQRREEERARAEAERQVIAREQEVLAAEQKHVEDRIKRALAA